MLRIRRWAARLQAAQLGALLDEWFPRLCRVAGLALLVYAGFFDHLDNPAMLPLGFGLVFFENIYRGRKGD